MVLSQEEIEKRVADSYELPNEVLKEVPDPIISIRTSTYNHAPYIRQCIEGVLMQKTSFPFEYIIGEDFSTDETREIVFEYARKYPNIIRVVTADYNVGSKANGQRCIKRCRGKYMAICEGDDYWTDPLKLQKQVDFLESHEDYGLVHTMAKVYIDSQKKFKAQLQGRYFSHVDELIISNHIVTLTTCYRTEFYSRYVNDVHPSTSWKMGDYPMWIYISLHSKVHFIEEVTGVYRVLENSASRSSCTQKNIDFCMSVYSISKYFAEKYHKDYLLDDIKRYIQCLVAHTYVLYDKKVNLSTFRLFGRYLFTGRVLLISLFSVSKVGRTILRKRWTN
ncbi:glycosyltransferase [Bacteroides sp.]|uniref:glycosyltransferase n=1 Tax=Bacteroides sp. TaxID=29523 RepID=UPI003AB46745